MAIVGPRRLQEVERLLHPRDAVLTGDAVRLELLGHVAGSDPEDDPAAGEVVEDGHVLGQFERGVERDEESTRAEPHPLGARRGCREREQRARAPAVRLHVVRGDEDGLVAEFLGARQAVEHVPVGPVERDAGAGDDLEGEEQAELHAGSSIRKSRVAVSTGVVTAMPCPGGEVEALALFDA